MEFSEDTAICLRVLNNNAEWSYLDESLSTQTWNQLQDWNELEDWDWDKVARLVPFWPYITKFRDWFFITNSADSWLYYEAVWQWNVLNLWLLVWTLAWWQTLTYDFIPRCVYNYADTFFLVSLAWILLRYQPLTNDFRDVANWKIIRYFGARKWICWLSQSWNYLKIYVTDWTTTECHYAQWTFDLEESWMVQTIKYEWQLLEDCLATNWDTDYGLFLTGSWTMELREMSWYWTTTIRRTKYIADTPAPLFVWEHMDVNWEMWLWSRVRYRNWVLYCMTKEWIWTFSKESVWSHWWTWWWVIEWNNEWFNDDCQMDFFWENLVVLTSLDTVESPYEYNWYYDLYRMSLLDNPPMYESDGVIIGNVYSWWVWSLFKKNVSTTIVCWKTNNTISLNDWDLNIQVMYRYDREYLWLTTNWFHLLKEISPTKIYDSIFITTPDPVQPAWTQMYNKPWNTIEYAIQLHTENLNVSPVLYEHNLIYEDSMRKYR